IERLLCLSMLASLILSQLLGGDLNDIKTEIFLPLIGILSRIPLYPKRQSTMNDKQYLEAIGYIEKQDGDQRRLETETEFLNRMNGLIRLFCKLLVSRGPPFDKDLAFAWKWFADVLNLPPKSNITSILICVFLDEADEIMIKAYPAQFPKLINAVRIQYIFKGLINYGLEAFKNAIKLSLNHIFTSLRSCSIGLILKLMKYWLECMGIIGAVAESNNINFVKYMNKCYSDEIYINNISSLNNEHYLEWKRVKDPDFIRIITVSLEDIFHGKVCNVIVQRKICDINKQIPEIEEARYQVIIEPGCIDGKNISFY
ncbi:unnamed protein product, partial [Rotaria sp. Silwood1]